MSKALVSAMFLLLTISVSSAKELTITDQEQTIIGQVCEIAARASNIPITNNAQIASWCVQWDQKVKGTAPVVQAPAPEAKKE